MKAAEQPCAVVLLIVLYIVALLWLWFEFGQNLSVWLFNWKLFEGVF